MTKVFKKSQVLKIYNDHDVSGRTLISRVHMCAFQKHNLPMYLVDHKRQCQLITEPM